ncbi:NAD-dependent epimerase/dehydratase family protein [Asanoa sp. WMMD1127]|uniref:NAD-dependent epimerase/dehydratase family protein n=1 Tax=Asanoa sp. WMMD1127 TaxID=3016107 RepID=UPI0024159C49|nr:NAD-dependent epimerase/dehydratase family protein [Asanoa sp. WMMD1127]MDG4825527.1 NAD-dependent epimerase/dehydratase family protein [Asanoa sp. WMMD1127]
MRVAVTGASGNIGTALVRWLARRAEVTEIVGLARRRPPADAPYDRVRWFERDLRTAGDLAQIVHGAAAVVHLAWDIVPAHHRPAHARTNRVGSRNLVDAVVRARVPHLVHLSSAAVYSPHRQRTPVTEEWPRRGIATSAYSRDKVDVEDRLDEVEADGLRVTRIRPPAVVQPAAASEIVTMIAGRAAPLVRVVRGRVPLLPLPRDAAVQVVAADDVASLAGRAILARATGAFNAADEPPITPSVLARLLGGRHLAVPRAALRTAMDASWCLRLQPLDGSWLDLVMDTPLLDCARARAELGWRPAHDARLTVLATRRAAARGAGAASPPLAPLSDRAGDGERR